MIFILGCSPKQEGFHVDLTLDELIAKMGKPDYNMEKIIDKEYIPYEFEPDFSKFFNNDDETIKVKILRWEKFYIYIVWLKNINNNWIVIDSLKHSRFINF
jgi:hypothetical protein